MYQVELYADGACSGNPGPAGIGVVLKSGKHRKELGTAIGEATNNIAELRAVIEGIKLLKTLLSFLRKHGHLRLTGSLFK